VSVLDGPRQELRRIALGGRIHVCKLAGAELVLDDGRTIVERDAIYAPPVEPTTIVCVHLNYRSRAIEFQRELEGTHPTYFVKPAASINSHRGELVRPADCQLLNYEGEIAAVVGRPMRRVRAEDVWDHLAGFTCANDVGAHDFRDTDAGSMLRVKGQDSFCPLGPGLVSGIDIRQSVLRTYVNGEKVQEGSVADMMWGIDALFADLTRHLTLRTGDVVLTGTPWHSRPVFLAMSSKSKSPMSPPFERGGRSPAPDNGRGFPATVTKTSLGVALGSDYHVLKQAGQPPTAEQYRNARRDLIAKNMARGPVRKEPTS